MNKIVIELCPEDRARIDRLSAALENGTPAEIRTLYALDLGEAPENAAQAAEAAEPEKVQPQTETPTQPKNENDSGKDEATAVTVEDIRSKVLQLTGSGKKDEVRAIVKEYAEKVGDIPAGKRAEVLERLTALEG